MQAIPMTLRGAEKTARRTDFLKSVRRPEIIAAIAEAREHGDLKENAEYHAAREQQGFVKVALRISKRSCRTRRSSISPKCPTMAG